MMPTNVAYIFVLVGVCSSGGEIDFGAQSTWILYWEFGISQGAPST
jgi:hypothetical protein